MSRADDQAVTARREARDAAAKRRDEEFINDKRQTHAETMAKLMRLREQRLLAQKAAPEEPPPSPVPAPKRTRRAAAVRGTADRRRLKAKIA